MPAPISKAIASLLCFLLPVFCCQAQFYKNTIIKTKPNSLVLVNPTIGLEKVITKHISIDAEYMHRTLNWYNVPLDWQIGKGFKGDGFRILVGPRYYFTDLDEKIPHYSPAPFDHFVGLQFGYSETRTYGIFKKRGVFSQNMDKANEKENWYEINAVFGQQYRFGKRMSFEVYGLASYYLPHTKTVSIINPNTRQEGPWRTENVRGNLKLRIRFSVGIYLG